MDQPTHPAILLLAARPDLFSQQGSVDASWRSRGKKRFGPYYRLRYRDGRDQRSVYLGRSSPLVERVRLALNALQKPLRQRRALIRLQRQVRNSLRRNQQRLDALLRPLGLHRKGFEIRGWRTTPLRVFARLDDAARNAAASTRIKPFRLPRVRQIRFTPKGPAAAWIRQNRPKPPHLPEARLMALIDARDGPQRG